MPKYIIAVLSISFILAQEKKEQPDIAINFFKGDDKYILNWSANVYCGYPIYTAEALNSYNKIKPIYGLSIGTPLGFQAGLAYLTVNFDLLNYNFEKNPLEQADNDYFKGTVYQIGLNSGMFVNDLCISLTATMGKYHTGNGINTSLNIDLPYWGDFEVRSTIRFNTIPIDQKTSGYTGWVDCGISLGYEF